METAGGVEGRYAEMSTGEVMPGERWWQRPDVGLHSYEPEFIPTNADRPFRARMRGFITPIAELREVLSDPLVARRTAEQCRRDGNQQVLVSAIVEAAQPLLFGHRDGGGIVTASRIVVSDMAQPFNVHMQSYHAVNLRLDRASVADAIGTDPARLHGLVLGSTPLASLLFGQMQAFAQAMPAMADAARQVGLNAVSDLALGTLRLDGLPGGWEEGTHWAGLWQAACRFIARELGNAELSPDTLAEALRCSRTQLYRLFARHDRTVMGHVQECRLLRSRELLADPACRHSIATVAWLCGFEDPSAFSRGFRRRFGCQPRDVRRVARAEATRRH
jgi:AraC-like DNA-binding protein